MSAEGENPGSGAIGESAISPDAALADVASPPQQNIEFEAGYDLSFTAASVEAERAWANLIGLRDHFRHKGYWSLFLMTVMAFMVLFQSWLIWMVGGGWWDFTKYEWLLPTLMVQYLLQVAGLALVAVRSLFKDIS
jgi:hypothetical protein